MGIVYFIAFFLATTAKASTFLFWDDAELKTIDRLRLERLPPLSTRDTATNKVAFSRKAREFGSLLFHDERLSRDGKTSCASCHPKSQAFASSKIVQVVGRGPRNVPTLLGIAWHQFFFWDGRKDSLWSQALGPLTAKNEHDLTLKELSLMIAERYPVRYAAVFSPIHRNKIFAGDERYIKRVASNIGKAIAAFEMTIVPEPGPFDRYAEQVVDGQKTAATGGETPAMAACAQRGLKIFIGKGFCINCHNGPLFTNYHFHNTGAPIADMFDNSGGRMDGLPDLRKDPFNCKGPYADRKTNCEELEHAGGLLTGTFKTPTLRGVKHTAPYFHNGSKKTLRDVLQHYNDAPDGPGGNTELVPLRLDRSELTALECFLREL